MIFMMICYTYEYKIKILWQIFIHSIYISGTIYLDLRYMRLEGEHDVPRESVQVQIQGVQVTQVPKATTPSQKLPHFRDQGKILTVC